MMKKVMLAAAGMLASSVSVMAVDSDVAATVADETYSSDHFTSLYFSAGCGFDWMKNEGSMDDSISNANNGGALLPMKKQKPTSFVGVFGLGYQRVFAQHFLAGIEFDCTVGQKKDSDIYLEGMLPNGVWQSATQLPKARVKNKSVGLGLFAKLGYVFCGKHLVYTKLGVAWPSSKADLPDGSGKISKYDIDKGVFAAALGYQYKFTNRFSGFGEVTYMSHQKKDITMKDKTKWSLKTRESWGVRVGVACHLFTK